MKRKIFTEGRKITPERALELFEALVGRPATEDERRELADAWRRSNLPGPRPRPTTRRGRD